MANPKDNEEPSYAKASDGEEEDKVAAAYENISKKLDSIRNGKEIDESDESKESETEKSDGEELEEWKGPKPPEKESDESEEDDDLELRKVKLGGDDDGDDDEEPSDAEAMDGKDEDESKEPEEKESDESKESEESEEEPSKKWKPAQGDPLDEEKESDESDESREPKESEEKESDESKGEPDEFEETHKHPDPAEKQSQPDTLDDLTSEEDFYIPNLKGSRQEGSNIGYNSPRRSNEENSSEYNSPRRSNEENSSSGYNAPSKKESFSGINAKSSMDNNDPNNFFSQSNLSHPPKRANKFHLLILVMIGVAVIGFTVYILKGGFGEINISSTPSPSPSAIESPSPTPTPAPEPDRAQYKLRVLNGSGKTGLAGSVADKLKALGYQVEKTGNATNSAFTQTIVRVKPDNESIIAQIIKDLTPDFDPAGNTSLKDDDTVDIEIILGAK